jgi:hypothetical protein
VAALDEEKLASEWRRVIHALEFVILGAKNYGSVPSVNSPLMRLRVVSWINPAPAHSITPERKIPPKFPNFGKIFPYLPGKSLR